LIAALLLHAISQHVISASVPFMPSDGPLPAYAPVAQRFSTEAEARLFIKGFPMLLRLDVGADDHAHEYCAPRRGNWTLYADGRAQGLISETVGDTLSFVFPPGPLHHHLRFGMVSVTTLRTYENIGAYTFRARVGSWSGAEYGSAKGSCALAAGPPLLERRVDGLWGQRFSEPVADEFQLDWARDGASPCLALELEVAASSPQRARNKVKVYNLALY